MRVVVLTDEQFRKLLGALEYATDCGCGDDNWKSDELSALVAQVSAAVELPS